MSDLTQRPAFNNQRSARSAPRPVRQEASKFFALMLFGWMMVIAIWPHYLFFPIAGIGVSPYSMSMLAAEALAIWTLLSSPRRPNEGLLTTPQQLAVSTFAFYIFWQFICDLFGSVPGPSLMASLRNLVYQYGAVLVGWAFFRNTTYRAIIPFTLTLVMMIAGPVGLLESVLGRSFVSMIGAASLAASEDAVQIITMGYFREGMFRASAFYTHPIVYGQFMAALMPFAIVMLVNKRKLFRLLGLIALVVAPVAIYVSNTRSAIIVAIVSVGAMLVLMFGTRSKSPGAMIAFAAIGGLIGGLFFAIFADDIKALVIGRNVVEMGSSEVRDEMLQTGLTSIMESPIFGFGEGMSPNKAGMVGANDVLTIDNMYLSILLDFGYVGLLVEAIFIICVLVSGFKISYFIDERADKYTIFAAMSFIISISFGQYIMSIFDNMLYIYFFLGVFLAVRPIMRHANLRRPQVIEGRSGGLQP